MSMKTEKSCASSASSHIPVSVKNTVVGTKEIWWTIFEIFWATCRNLKFWNLINFTVIIW